MMHDVVVYSNIKYNIVHFRTVFHCLFSTKCIFFVSFFGGFFITGTCLFPSLRFILANLPVLLS
ncbi:hypothetical protein T439DRAFT_19124 [Meredithblackwellia eburnea MCA 4105]